ncbi:prolyl 4-hydroxylase subunit alpha-2-like [Tubulanus polymorphus]|uniref:prolyl 4-hydroxylase subunit alpha-2-like n=1 Tax=Tubulanus polymorphus TaxID=672921 RepID=UPI003DA2A8C2
MAKDFRQFVLLPVAVGLILMCVSQMSQSVEIAPSEMLNRRLVYMENELITFSNLFIHAERFDTDWDDDDVKNMTQLKSFLETNQALNEHTSEHMLQYTAHPIGAYILTKRLVKEWTDKWEIMKRHRLCRGAILDKLLNIFQSMPNEKDLEETVIYVLRLQQIYGLKVDDVAKGKIGDNITEPLSPEDCEIFAQRALDMEDYLLALEWYEYIAKLGRENPKLERLTVVALVRIGSIYYRNRNYAKAVEFTQKALKTDSTNNAAKRALEFYQSAKRSDEAIPIKPRVPKAKINALYESVCSGKLTKKNSVTSHPDYNCFLAPRYRRGYVFYKVEYAHRNPDILYFHKVINQKFMRKLLVVLDRKLTESVFSDHGYTKQRHWAIISDESRRGEKLNKLFTTLTGIDYKLSQSPYVAFNFASGVTEAPFVDLETVQTHGKNSTTFIVFLNDVLAGGNIVFPWLKLSVKPERGSALFFYNNKPSGIVNKKLLWGECPVIIGPKWVAHKIYREWENDPPKHGNLMFDLWDL